MRIFFFLLALSLVSTAEASPFVSCDIYLSKDAAGNILVTPTDFVYVIDTLPEVSDKALVVPTGVQCHYDLGPLNLTAGPHTVKAASVLNDPIYGIKRSDFSSAVTITVPPTPPIPKNIIVTPK